LDIPSIFLTMLHSISCLLGMSLLFYQ
jgi:hypothetical protein